MLSLLLWPNVLLEAPIGPLAGQTGLSAGQADEEKRRALLGAVPQGLLEVQK